MSRSLHAIFIDFKKEAHNVIPRDLIKEVLRRPLVPLKYIGMVNLLPSRLLKMCTEVQYFALVSAAFGLNGEFPVMVCLHQESTLSLYLFIVSLDTLTQYN